MLHTVETLGDPWYLRFKRTPTYIGPDSYIELTLTRISSSICPRAMIKQLLATLSRIPDPEPIADNFRSRLPQGTLKHSETTIMTFQKESSDFTDAYFAQSSTESGIECVKGRFAPRLRGGLVRTEDRGCSERPWCPRAPREG